MRVARPGTVREPFVHRRGRTALVTGAASGIGRATALRLAREGYALILLDIDGEGLKRTRRAAASDGAETHLMECDLSHFDRLPALFEEAFEHYGQADLLVNVAGVGIAATTVDTDPSDWDRLMAINLTAVFHTCRLTLPHMIAAGEGIIVNVSSVAGVVGVRQRAAYCATKAGVIGLTRAIAADHAGQGIRANAICPGTVATEWIEKILEGAEDPAASRKAMEARQLDGRMGTPDEVAAGIAFLASDDARFVNGAAFVMDGGMTVV
jgi:NAD(P)-dependent dehydrogenase (short-subunit alcohol dehydrogenase family)